LSAIGNLWDVNIWLALLDPANPNHAAAKAREVELVGPGAIICRVSQMACLRLLTTAAVMGPQDTRSMVDAWREVDRFLARSDIHFHGEPPELERVWREFTALEVAAPKRWTDAYLAAFALAGGLRLVTFDQGFRKFPGVDLLIVESI
jgi:uncharacterized protein